VHQRHEKRMNFANANRFKKKELGHIATSSWKNNVKLEPFSSRVATK
jgi:hypothetical protein